MTHPLYVALVWHMHQPYYKDLRTGGMPMPWVRLHAAKDYLHMAEVLAQHPGVHVTINMVPSLVEQMVAWAEGREADDLVRIAEQERWSDADRRFILQMCFSVNWDNIIRRYPRYAGLLDRRPDALADPAAFSDADYRDLVAWFNLAWIDPGWLRRDPSLHALVEQGRDFSVADVQLIHAKQREIAGRVLPLYRELAASGQLEICTSPYFHPVLPLLIDTDCARAPSPGLPLPVPAYQAVEDAAAQLAAAVQAHTAAFGAPPAGLWPSEGGVSPAILPLVREAGFKWLATDEIILGRSLGRGIERDAQNLVTDPRSLYRAYRVMAGTELGPSIIFRDHELSDRIGFLYQRLPGHQSADDMIYRLLEIQRRISDPESPYLVSIILDGENCWEHYEQNGDVFLHALYSAFERRGELAAVTVTEFLAGRRPAATLARLATGSWISGDFTTWIGDPEHNQAWDALRRTRAHFLSRSNGCAAPPSDAARRQALHALHAAEGSDWFWWFSHRNRSDQDALFDSLFRQSLAAVFDALGDEVPAWLDEPIQRAGRSVDHRAATGYVTPTLSAEPFPGDDWARAASLASPTSSGAMQRAEGLIERLMVGHDARRLFLRLDLRRPAGDYEILIYGSAPHRPANQQVDAHFDDPDQAPSRLAAAWLLRYAVGQPAPFLYAADGHGNWSASGPVASAGGEKVRECAIALSELGLAPGDDLRLYLVLAQDGRVVATLPERKMAVLSLPVF